MSVVTGYARATGIVWDALLKDLADIDSTVAAYLLLRASALTVREIRGREGAAELLYGLADELAAGDGV